MMSFFIIEVLTPNETCQRTQFFANSAISV